MLFRLTSAVVFVLAIAGTSRAQAWGDLEGDFFLKGDAKAEKIVADKDPEYCGKKMLVRENIVFDPATKAIANVAVYLFIPAGGKKPPVHPDYEKTAKDKLSLDNKGCRFEPHVLAIRTTQTLVISNSDPIGHNTKAEFFENVSFNDLIPAGGKIDKSFPKPEAGFSPASCSIHGWMSAQLLVKEDPYAGISDKKGHVSIKNIPVGEWTFIVWQENVGGLTTVTVDGKPTMWPRGGKVKMTIKPGVNKLGKVEIEPAALKLKKE